jgi:excisionase family DNA binding protein
VNRSKGWQNKEVFHGRYSELMSYGPEGGKMEFNSLPQKTLLRPDEVALFLSVSLKTIYRWHDIGVIEGTRLRRVLRIYRDSVVKWVEENRTGGE